MRSVNSFEVPITRMVGPTLRGLQFSFPHPVSLGTDRSSPRLDPDEGLRRSSPATSRGGEGGGGGRWATDRCPYPVPSRPPRPPNSSPSSQERFHDTHEGHHTLY